jgi:hypothetical protein
MARKAILDTYYVFTPSTRTIVIPRAIPRERLVLITDVTTNQVIFNFSDSTLSATSYTITNDGLGNANTTIVLAYNTTNLSATDKLQILIDEYAESMKPNEEYTDPVNKFRVSTPQALIDTDFEYGTQSTKWESLSLLNNIPFAYYNLNNPITITNVSATNGSRNVVVATTTPPAGGVPVYIQDTNWSGADGLYIVDSNIASTSFSYTARVAYTGATGTIYNAAQTAVYQGNIFSNANIGISTVVANGTNASNVQITTSVPHGLSIGNEVAVVGTSATTFSPNGSWIVSTISNSTAFSVYTTSAPTGSITAPTGANVYVRPQGQTIHRAFDGGVQFSTFAASHNHQMVRQTRRYFRYQSGKGIQMSTGSILKPNFNVDSITSSGTTVTVVTKIQHNINMGATIQISGCNETAYNGTFSVTAVLDAYRFTYTTLSTPTAAQASGNYVLAVTGWYGASTRVGMFDSQNGIFFEFDGQSLFAVRRSSTYQLSGFIAATPGSSTITGISINGVTTAFSKQLQPNDFVVIRGMSYRVLNIASDTSLTVTPAYRGSVAVTQGVMSKTIDYKIPSNLWNIDRCDGTGPSGFSVDLTKMEMFYLDYSWYGAGFIRWGFRGPDGNVIYCHKLVNNNVNYEAYMRSGNLPGRYETNTFSKSAILTKDMGSANTVAYLSDTMNWPPIGTLVIRNANQVEYVNYTAKSQDALLPFTLTSGNTVVTGTNTTGIVAGMFVMGNGIPTGSTVQSVVAGTSVTLSQPVTITGLQTLTFNPQLVNLTRAQPGGNLTFTTTANSITATGSVTSGVQIGQYIIGTGIQPGTQVNAFVTNTSITMNQAATASGTVTLTFAPMGNTTAQTFSYSATAPTAVELQAPQFAATISHWGTSVIMDGRFDDDKSFVFTQGQTSSTVIAPGVRNVLQSFRIAPSVSNGVTSATLGSRELINRMQMVLRQMDLYSNGSFLVQLVLNGVVGNTASGTNATWLSVGGSSLAQYINHGTNVGINGGETIFGFFLNSSAGASTFGASQQDLILVRDMGTSILSGGSIVANLNIYPDGPDQVHTVVQNLGTSNANVFARMSWTEAQA